MQYADDYKAMNPQCELPTLEIDGHVLTQSVSDSKRYVAGETGRDE